MTRWLSQDEQASWRNFIRIQHDLMTALEADLAPYGLSMGDYHVLVMLSEAPDRQMRMCDLAGTLQLSPSGLTRRLDGLVRNGWVERASCPTDRRVAYAHLTEAGFEKLKDTAPHHVDSVRRRIVTPLGKDGMSSLGEIFARIGDHLEQPQPAR